MIYVVFTAAMMMSVASICLVGSTLWMETAAVCADVVVPTHQSTRHSVQKDWTVHEYPASVVLILGLLNAVLINSTRPFSHVHLGHVSCYD
jgi:hypothetical protein